MKQRPSKQIRTIQIWADEGLDNRVSGIEERSSQEPPTPLLQIFLSIFLITLQLVNIEVPRLCLWISFINLLLMGP
jgi:hypothetical protein